MSKKTIATIVSFGPLHASESAADPHSLYTEYGANAVCGSETRNLNPKCGKTNIYLEFFNRPVKGSKRVFFRRDPSRDRAVYSWTREDNDVYSSLALFCRAHLGLTTRYKAFYVRLK